VVVARLADVSRSADSFPNPCRLEYFEHLNKLLLVGRVGLEPTIRRIMRSLASCTVRNTCTDTTEPCRRWP
jgi:hypothetical protein